MNDSRSVDSSSKTPQPEDKRFSVVVIAPEDDRQSTPLLDSDSNDVGRKDLIEQEQETAMELEISNTSGSAMVCNTLYRSCLLHDSTVLPRAGDNTHDRAFGERTFYQLT